MPAPLAIEANGIDKKFGHFQALKNLNLRVEPGESVVIFGRNGAGKTTFLRIAATLARPSAGTIHIAGRNLAEEPEEARREIGFLSHQTFVYRDLTPIENLAFFARLYGITDRARIDRLLERVGLWRRRNDPVRRFSRGLQQRVGIARALLHDPQILLMDEPYTGLDAHASSTLDAIRDEAGAAGRTVVMTSHLFEAGIRRCRRAVIIDRGEIVFNGPSHEPAARAAFGQFVAQETDR